LAAATLPSHPVSGNDSAGSGSCCGMYYSSPYDILYLHENQQKQAMLTQAQEKRE
jgi:hypothetical protein